MTERPTGAIENVRENYSQCSGCGSEPDFKHIVILARFGLSLSVCSSSMLCVCRMAVVLVFHPNCYGLMDWVSDLMLWGSRLWAWQPSFGHIYAGWQTKSRSPDY